MDDKDFFQKLSGEMLDFFDWVGDTLGDPLARAAIVRDLGGEPSNLPAPTPMPGDKLDAVKAFRDASHPSAEAAIAALADIAVLLDAVASQAEAWSDSFESGAEDLGHALLELMASNFFRLRAPRLFLLMQAISTLEDVTSTYGPGSNNLVNVGESLLALLGFLWQPGKSLEQLAPGPDARPDRVAPTMDFLARVAAVVLGALDRDDDIKVMKDVMTGWDGRGLDVDSTDTPLRSDVISAATVTTPRASPRRRAGSTSRPRWSTRSRAGPRSSWRSAATPPSRSRWETGGRSRSSHGWTRPSRSSSPSTGSRCAVRPVATSSSASGMPPIHACRPPRSRRRRRSPSRFLRRSGAGSRSGTSRSRSR
jgi:hypothetical protein